MQHIHLILQIVTTLIFIYPQSHFYSQAVYEIDTANRTAIHIKQNDADGILIDNVGGTGLHIGAAGTNGVRVNSTGGNGISISNTFANGVGINGAGMNGMTIDNVSQDALRIGPLVERGVYIEDTRDNGLHINKSSAYGIYLNSIGSDAVHVNEAPNGYGVFVSYAGKDGLRVNDAAQDAIFVNSANGWSGNLQGVKNDELSPNQPEDHIVQMYNRSTGTQADVLALKVGDTDDPTINSNFVSFFDGDDDSIGRIKGDGRGGVIFESGGADFAEYLISNKEEVYSIGDVVGVVNGKITLETAKAHEVMVITDQPIILGNQNVKSKNAQPISFIGQVPVKVKGKVTAGDWIVASNQNDGTGIAISTEFIQPNHKIVGRAWEGSIENEVKTINTVVGLDHSKAKDEILQHLLEKTESQQQLIDQLISRLDALERK